MCLGQCHAGSTQAPGCPSICTSPTRGMHGSVHKLTLCMQDQLLAEDTMHATMCIRPWSQANTDQQTQCPVRNCMHCTQLLYTKTFTIGQEAMPSASGNSSTMNQFATTVPYCPIAISEKMPSAPRHIQLKLVRSSSRNLQKSACQKVQSFGSSLESFVVSTAYTCKSNSN